MCSPPWDQGGERFLEKFPPGGGTRFLKRQGGDNFRRGNPDFQITWWRNWAKIKNWSMKPHVLSNLGPFLGPNHKIFGATRHFLLKLVVPHYIMASISQKRHLRRVPGYRLSGGGNQILKTQGGQLWGGGIGNSRFTQGGLDPSAHYVYSDNSEQIRRDRIQK